MTKKQLYKLHKKYATLGDKDRLIDLVWTHSQIVAKIADYIADNLMRSGVKVNRSLIQIGALVHDIGVYGCFDEDLNPDNKLPEYIMHGEIGYKWLKEENLSEEITRFALVHTGTGITSEDITREKLPFNPGDYIPVTLEEEIVCYADKFHTKYPSFNTFDEQKAQLSKFDPSKAILMDRFKKKFGVPDLSALENKYKSWKTEFDAYFKTLEEKRHE